MSTSELPRRTVLGASATAALLASAEPAHASSGTQRFEHDPARVLRNPLSGWVLYGTGKPADDFWSHYDDLGVFEYAQTLYFRIGWHLLNPAEGVYGWDVDPTLRWMLDNARQRGLKLAFRVVVDSRDKSESFTPAWVREAGVQGYETQTGSATVWSPYPDDPRFQELYARFVEAFAARFDDEEQVDFVDGYGLGKWGEGHSVRYLDETSRRAVFDWIVDLYLRHFRQVPLALNYHRMIGTSKDWGDPDPLSAELLESAFEKGYVLRHDAFGMTDYYGQWEKDLAARWRYRRPILFEGGWVTKSHDFSVDPRGYETVADVRYGEFEDAQEAHVDALDLRVGETDSWFTEVPELRDAFVARGGYRLLPSEVRVPDRLRHGRSAELRHTWTNAGWGFCPNDLPLWNFRYRAAFALLDQEGRVAQVFVDPGTDPSQWRSDRPVEYRFTVCATVRSGNYRWAAAVVDTTRQNRPGLRLAARGEFSDDGWLLLGRVDVR